MFFNFLRRWQILFLIFGSFVALKSFAGPVPIVRKLVLKEDIRQKLNGQMLALQSNMEKIIDLISRGQWSELEKLGETMSQENFSPKDLPLKEFPPEFIKYAQEFIESSRHLGVAAKKQHGTLVLSNYHRLLSTCMKCHADFAPNLFDKKKEYLPPEELPKRYYKPPGDWR